MLYGPNTNVGSNSVIFMLEAQARYIVRALKHMRRKGKTYVAVRPAALAEFIAKIDQWMVGTVWTTQCSNYFRAANGRVVTQWPRSARSFWGMTRRFKPADFSFSRVRAEAASARLGQAKSMTELDGAERLDPVLRAVATTRTDFSAESIQLIRGPFNERRRETAEHTDTSGVARRKRHRGSRIRRHTRSDLSRRAVRRHRRSSTATRADSRWATSTPITGSAWNSRAAAAARWCPSTTGWLRSIPIRPRSNDAPRC